MIVNLTEAGNSQIYDDVVEVNPGDKITILVYDCADFRGVVTNVDSRSIEFYIEEVLSTCYPGQSLIKDSKILRVNHDEVVELRLEKNEEIYKIRKENLRKRETMKKLICVPVVEDAPF